MIKERIEAIIKLVTEVVKTKMEKEEPIDVNDILESIEKLLENEDLSGIVLVIIILVIEHAKKGVEDTRVRMTINIVQAIIIILYSLKK
jgi:hypothetical protein